VVASGAVEVASERMSCVRSIRFAADSTMASAPLGLALAVMVHHCP
jgi:hypothetical protein